MAKACFDTEEKIELFIFRYINYTTEEMIKEFYNDLTKKQIDDKIYYLRKSKNKEFKKSKETLKRVGVQKGIKTSAAHKGKIISKETRKKIGDSRKGKSGNSLGTKRTEESKKKISDARKKSGSWSGNNNPRFKNPLYGDKNGRWNNGSKQLYWDLREFIEEWKIKSVEFYNYTCIISGKNYREIHHLFPFRKIADMTFEELGLDYRDNLNMYTLKERFSIKDKLLEIHYRYPLGVPMIKKYHKEFHDIYGYTNFSIDDFNSYLASKNINIKIS